jgi:nanoRNase/pAp phosphatase (c-di-AMP/oligoRNAs hydrolase)
MRRSHALSQERETRKSMALNQSQQILETVTRAARPVICLPQNASLDVYATALGLARLMGKLGKADVPVVCAAGASPKELHFLHGYDRVKGGLENLQQFTIELDASRSKVDRLNYELRDNKLFVYLSPKAGCWNEKDVKVSASGYRYDLIVTVGAPDLESLGPLFAQHPEFFYKTPVLNIDHASENEHYGAINAVDLTACACGEVAFELFESIDPTLVDAEAATAFLAGMIAKTRSFKSKRVTPATLQTASRLVSRGGARETIVEHLFRTRSVQTLRLWGRALARLKVDALSGVVWTLLSRQDFLNAGAEEENLQGVIDELIASSPEAKIVVLLYEDRARRVCGVLRAERPADALSLAKAAVRGEAETPSAAGNREDARLCFTKGTIVEIERRLLPAMIAEAKRAQT